MCFGSYAGYAVGLQLWLNWPPQVKKKKIRESDQYTGISDFFFPILSNYLQNTSVAVPGTLNS